MAIRAILFDNDGTLVDTHDVILLSMRHATSTVLGRTIPDDKLMEKVGIPLDMQMMDFADGDTALRDELLRVYRAHNHEHHDGMVKLFDGVAEGLSELKAQGLALGVVTSKRHALAQHGLEILGVWPCFDFLIGADDCPRGKPDPDPIILGAERMGVQTAECIYLGDSPYDIAAGNAAGCLTVAALWGMFEPAQIAPETPDRTCTSFPDFVRLAGELSRNA